MSRNKNARLNNIITIIKILYIIQVGLVLFIAVYRLMQHYSGGQIQGFLNIDFVLLFITFLMFLNGYFLIKDVRSIHKWQNTLDMQKDALNNIKKLNRDLRAQRHDFLNHIQIVYSLMELQEYDEVVKYLNKLYGDVGKLSANIRTDIVALNALLQAKSNEADRKGITYIVDIKTRLSHTDIPEWELCRCVGNLIDNAFTATLHSKEKHQVYIRIIENLLDYELVISNTGAPIPEEAKDKIYEAGYTTKKDVNKNGMGLYIVKNILEKYKGEIRHRREGNQTVFVMTVPKVTVET